MDMHSRRLPVGMEQGGEHSSAMRAHAAPTKAISCGHFQLLVSDPYLPQQADWSHQVRQALDTLQHSFLKPVEGQFVAQSMVQFAVCKESTTFLIRRPVWEGTRPLLPGHAKWLLWVRVSDQYLPLQVGATLPRLRVAMEGRPYSATSSVGESPGLGLPSPTGYGGFENLADSLATPTQAVRIFYLPWLDCLSKDWESYALLSSL